MALGLPFFPDAVGRLCIGSPGARDMENAPQGGEIRVTLLFVAEDGFEVELEKVGAGQGVGIPEEAEGFAIGHESPEGVRGGVEVFLGELMGGFFAGAGSSDGELGDRFIERGVVRGNDDGDASTEGVGSDGESAFRKGDGFRQKGEVGEPEALLEQFEDEAAGDLVGIAVGAEGLGGESVVGGGGDAEGATVFVVELESAREGVIGVLLVGGLAAGGAFEEFGDEEGALEAEGVEGEAVGGRAAAGHGRGGLAGGIR